MAVSELRSNSSLRDRVSPAEWQARIDLAAAYRLAELKGWQDDYRIFNHFSARVPEEPDHLLIKPHDLLFGEVTASSLIKVHSKGPKKGFSDNVNPAGFAIHTAVMNARPDVNAILHLHSQAGMALSALGGGLKFFTQEGMRFYNRIGYHAFEGIAEVDEGPHLVRDLAHYNTLILRNHGLLTCGPSMSFAVMGLGTLIRMADIQLRMMATGDEIVEPAPEICENTAKQYVNSTQHGAEWKAILRYLDRQDSSFRD